MAMPILRAFTDSMSKFVNKARAQVWDCKMTIPADELPLRSISKSKLMKSKTGGKDYHLIGFEWIPDQIEL